jgi:hypothetical protein
MELDYNDCTTWGQKAVYTPPSFPVEQYQERINRICGLAPNGEPVVRLVWAASKECFSKFYCVWDSMGFGVLTELRAKYRFATVEINAIDNIDIPAPRWMLEDRVDPAQFAATYEQTRWVWNEDEQRQVERRPRMDLSKGYYAPLLTIAQHGLCCKKARVNKVVCWGEYKEPDETELIMLRQAVEKRDLSEKQSPFEALTRETLETGDRECVDAQARLRAERLEKMSNAIDDNPLKFLSYFTGVGFGEKVKGFSDGGGGQ